MGAESGSPTCPEAIPTAAMAARVTAEAMTGREIRIQAFQEGGVAESRPGHRNPRIHDTPVSISHHETNTGVDVITDDLPGRRESVGQPRPFATVGPGA